MSATASLVVLRSSSSLAATKSPITVALITSDRPGRARERRCVSGFPDAHRARLPHVDLVVKPAGVRVSARSRCRPGDWRPRKRRWCRCWRLGRWTRLPSRDFRRLRGFRHAA